MMPKLPVKLLLLLYCGLCACMHTPAVGSAEDKPIPLRILYQDALCDGNRPTPSVTLVADPDQLKQIFIESKGRMLGQSPPTPAVDFDAEHVVDIQMGQKPTGGYGIELAEPNATFSGGEALIRLRWIEPAPGAMVTQILTSPCLIIALPKGAYEKIAITDENGKVRKKVYLP
ncbi:MAG: protease complex subunit PrcB family protein [Desulfobacterales bacterium]